MVEAQNHEVGLSDTMMMPTCGARVTTTAGEREKRGIGTDFEGRRISPRCKKYLLKPRSRSRRCSWTGRWILDEMRDKG